jgi:hypothetical protein
MAAAIVAPVSTLDALVLSPDAGSLVSGDRRWENDGVTQSFSEIIAALGGTGEQTIGDQREQ